MLVETVPSVNDFVVKAVALTLREFPAFNSSFVDGRCERHGRVNVGIAVATEDALLVPAVVDADAKPLAAIASETRDLVERARRAGGSRPTSSRPRRSRLESRACSACARSPRSSTRRRWRSSRSARCRRSPVETAAGGVVFRDVAELTLTADHRAIYGADAARFLGRLRQLLEHPLALVL